MAVMPAKTATVMEAAMFFTEPTKNHASKIKGMVRNQGHDAQKHVFDFSFSTEFLNVFEDC